ncbi:MAG: hypothetical protein PGN19_02250 [Pseudomonas oryzihabitans]
MKRSLSALLLTLATLTCAQAAFADENPSLRYKLVDQNHAAMQHYADQSAQGASARR